MYRSERVKQLCEIEADLSAVPERNFPTRTGTDGKRYYVINYRIRITYHSAYTKYELLYNGRNYDEVRAEYV